MPYKIAVASSDGIRIDETFGAAQAFLIYEVSDQTYVQTEVRNISQEETQDSNCGQSDGCGQGGCQGSASGCSGKEGASKKVELIGDCRCVVCKKIGFHIQKQLERKAITSFDVTCTVQEALEKITSYFYKVDNHQSIRGISAQKDTIKE